MKQVRSSSTSSLARAALAALAVAAMGAPLVAQAQSELSPQATYRQDRANCLAGRTTQPRALCLYDARLALEAARDGRFAQFDDSQLQRNALSRCDAVPTEARDSCLRLVRGEGQREGSVEEGIVVMWLDEFDSDTTATSQNAIPQ